MCYRDDSWIERQLESQRVDPSTIVAYSYSTSLYTLVLDEPSIFTHYLSHLPVSAFHNPISWYQLQRTNPLGGGSTVALADAGEQLSPTIESLELLPENRALDLEMIR